MTRLSRDKLLVDSLRKTGLDRDGRAFVPRTYDHAINLAFILEIMGGKVVEVR